MSEITKTQDQNSKTKIQIKWLFFLALIIFVYLFGLSIPLLGPDEPRYSQVAREMFQKSDWITPTLGGANWFEKPALLYWLQIASYKLFGVSEFAARFGSALFGLATIFSLWIFGKTVVKSSEESQASNEFSHWLALISASSIGLLVFSRGASFDIILTFPITASLVCFYIFDSKPVPSKNFVRNVWLLGFYFFIGVSLLAKGLIGIVFPFAIVAFYFLLSRKLPIKSFIFSLFWGTLVSLIVAAVWYVPMYQTHGWTFIDEFFVQHHFARYTSNKYQHPQPFHFFFWVLPLMTLPWLPFFLASIWTIAKDFFQRGKDDESQINESPNYRSSQIIFAVCWLFVPLAFFSLSGSKLPGYILPALPAALILTASYIDSFVQKSQKRRNTVQAIAVVFFGAIIITLQFFVPLFAKNDTTKYLIEIADANGYQNAKVLNLHTISHNAEFYAANRLIRNDDGKLRKYLGVTEVVEEIKRQNGNDVLVLVSPEYLHELPESNLVESKILGDHSELVIVAVKLK